MPGVRGAGRKKQKNRSYALRAFRTRCAPQVLGRCYSRRSLFFLDFFLELCELLKSSADAILAGDFFFKK